MSSAPSPPASADQRDGALAAILFAAAFAVYLASPVRQMADSHYALLVSEAILRHGEVTVDRFLDGGVRDGPGVIGVPVGEIAGAGTEYPYQLERTSRGLHYRYGLGTSVLSLPFVVALDAAGLSAVDARGKYDPQGEARAQALIASALAAIAAALLFLAARPLVPAGPALACAVAAAFASPLWSTASRALWSHAWGVALLSFAAMLVARGEGGRGHRPALLATVLAWAFFVRPTNAIPAVAVAVWMLFRSRRDAVRLVATGGAWLALFVAFTLATRGETIPLYYQGRRLIVSRFGEALLGHLVSPSRGMLVTTPLFAFAAWLALRHARGPSARRVSLLVAGIAVAHLLVLAFMRRWWAGWSYSSRVATELVPWFVLLAACSLASIATHRRDRRRLSRAEGILAVVCLAWSAACHGAGALSERTWEWNAVPWPIDADPHRAWSWARPQPLAALTGVERLPVPPLDAGEMLSASEAARRGLLARGFDLEGGRAWLSGTSAVLRWRPRTASVGAVCRMRAVLAARSSVVLGVRVNGEEVADLPVPAGRSERLLAPAARTPGPVVLYLEASRPRSFAVESLGLDEACRR